MKLGVIVEGRYLRQNMPGAVTSVLISRDIAVDSINPNHDYFKADTGIFVDSAGNSFNLNSYDLVVSRNRDALGLVLMRFIEEAGIPTINTHSAVQKVRNKAKMAVALSLAGIPSAPTFIADKTEFLAEHVKDYYPLILKATYGDNSQGLTLVRSAEELSELHWSSEMVLAQHYLSNHGYDLKLYVCGQHVFAVRKPSPFNGDINAAIEHLEPDKGMTDIALKCGKLFGLELYGVDTIETDTGPLVIEVNDYPNYTDIPGSAELIADHILSRLR